MTLERLKIVAGAGEPDDVLALRIDVVAAAEAWYKVYNSHSAQAWFGLDEVEHRLERAVRRYRGALKRREQSRGVRK